MKLEFHPEAEWELIEAAAYYEAKIPGLGERFGVEVRQAIDLLLAQPGMGVLAGPELRQFVLSRFPYSLIYSVLPDALVILVVAHQSRRPGYWRSRSVR